MPNSVYIHIPFCKSKCHYCSFISYPKLEMKKDYLKILEKEINSTYNNEQLNTLYFGGGTPSLLEPEEFNSLINHFNINENNDPKKKENFENNEKKLIDKVNMQKKDPLVTQEEIKELSKKINEQKKILIEDEL